MFRLRQRTRRQFCRAGFLIGCLAPTLALVLWGAYRHTPLHIRRLEMALERSLGLHVQVYGVTHPRPGLVCLQGVELSDTETGGPIAICDAASLRTPARSGATELSIHGLTIERGGLPACYDLLERVLHCGREAAERNLQLNVEQVSIAESGAADALSQATVSIRTSSFESEALLSITPAATGAIAEADQASGADKILLRVTRTRPSQGLLTSEWELRTNKQAIPCAWLTALAGELPGLEQSYFRGSCRAQQAGTDSQLAVLGSFWGVDVGSLANRCLDQALEGKVDIELTEPARIRAGRLVYLQARIAGGAGRISRSLLGTLATSLGCSAKLDSPGSDGLVPYERLALEIKINEQGQLALAGRCNSGSSAVLLNGDGRTLLSEPRPELQPQSVLNLVRRLGGASEVQIPATSSAALLFKRLPVAAAPAATPTVLEARQRRGGPSARPPEGLRR